MQIILEPLSNLSLSVCQKTIFLTCRILGENALPSLKQILAAIIPRVEIYVFVL